MSKARHSKSCRASGGGVMDGDADDADGVKVGGDMIIGKAAKPQMDKIGGNKAKARMDRPRRASGGRVPTATSPMSSAASKG